MDSPNHNNYMPKDDSESNSFNNEQVCFYCGQDVGNLDEHLQDHEKKSQKYKEIIIFNLKVPEIQSYFGNLSLQEQKSFISYENWYKKKPKGSSNNFLCQLTKEFIQDCRKTYQQDKNKINIQYK